MKRGILALLLSLVLCMSLLIPVASATSRTRDDAINWVKSKQGQSLDMDNSYGAQCVDLILAYYDYLGVSRVSGNGCDYAWNALPSGWNRIQGAQPQKGDILVYSGNDANPYGHVAIYESDNSHYHQNFDGKSYVCHVTCAYNVLSNPYWGVIRPNWSNSSASNAATPVSDGFVGRIYYPSGDKYLETRDGNLQIAKDDSTDPRQIWLFKQEGKGYRIVSLYDGSYWDAQGFGTENGTNIITRPGNGSTAELWYMYAGASAGKDCYEIVPSYNDQIVVDVSNAGVEAGTNVQIWERNGTNAQKFQVKSAGNAGGQISRNIGTDFYARISYKDTYLQTTAVEKGQGMDVRTTKMSRPDDGQQIWHFTRNSNGSYKIVNMYSGGCLAVDGNTAANSKNIWTYNEDNGSSSQQWYLVNSPGETKYRLVTALGYPKSMFSVDVYEGKTDEGTDVTLFAFNGGAHQQFNITKVDYNDNIAVTGVTVSRTSLTMKPGQAETLTATVSPTDAVEKSVTWTSSKDTVARVDSNGRVMAVAAGTADITATTADGGYTAACRVTVKADDVKATGVTVSKTSLTMEPGQSETLTAIVAPATAENTAVTWTSNDPSVATVTSSGRVNALAAGAAVVTVKTDDGGFTATCRIIVKGEDKPGPVEVHFPRANVYNQGQFTDVPAQQWYTDGVKQAFEFGLMKGVSAKKFNPQGNVTVAEAITMAARIHSIYTTGAESFGQTNPWYQGYLDYAFQNGIISYAYYKSDVTKNATRAQFAGIFANSLPEEALAAMNDVEDGAIPDVPMTDECASHVYKLYRAGILAGGDARGTFSPYSYITRQECAAIVSRMAESNSRVSFTLGA